MEDTLTIKCPLGVMKFETKTDWLRFEQSERPNWITNEPEEYPCYAWTVYRKEQNCYPFADDVTFGFVYPFIKL